MGNKWTLTSWGWVTGIFLVKESLLQEVISTAARKAA